MDFDSHTFAGAHCKFTGAHFLTIESIDGFLRKVNVETEPVGSAQQFKTRGVAG